jgi:hypothetical protein
LHPEPSDDERLINYHPFPKFAQFSLLELKTKMAVIKKAEPKKAETKKPEAKKTIAAKPAVKPVAKSGQKSKK